MPWSNLSPMDQKTQFIADFLRHSQSITDLCLHYNISRKTAYKWINRYQLDSISGLEDRSRKPSSCPHQTDPDLVEALLEARRLHPTWGAKKLLKLLSKRDPNRNWPARNDRLRPARSSRASKESSQAPPPLASWQTIFYYLCSQPGLVR